MFRRVAGHVNEANASAKVFTGFCARAGVLKLQCMATNPGRNRLTYFGGPTGQNAAASSAALARQTIPVATMNGTASK